MKLARSACTLPDPYSIVALFADIFATTAQMRKEFSPITKALGDCNLVYQWEYPTKLLVTYQNQIVPMHTPKEGYKLLSNGGNSYSLPPPATTLCWSKPSQNPELLVLSWKYLALTGTLRHRPDLHLDTPSPEWTATSCFSTSQVTRVLCAPYCFLFMLLYSH